MCDLRRGTFITAPSTVYIVKELLGSGTFGNVALCRKTSTQQEVALKIMKLEDDADAGEREMAILRDLKMKGSEDHNIIRWIDSFEFKGRYCLEFESLDISLGEFIHYMGKLSLMQIRPILYQLAKAMSFLKTHRIVHGDLKPDNVMMVNHHSSLQVKVIDFGLAEAIQHVTRGKIIQTSWYRAPEVFVGAHYDEAVDVWSLGCMAVEMHLGKALFPGQTDVDSIRQIVKTIGTPPNRVLERGKYTKKYFKQWTIRGTSMWRLKTLRFQKEKGQRTLNSLHDLYMSQNKEGACDKKLDNKLYVDLVIQMMHLNPAVRITAGDALLHPFLSMSHIVGVFNTEHVHQCVEMMRGAVGQSSEQLSMCSSTARPFTAPCRDMDSEEGPSHQVRKTVIMSQKATPLPHAIPLPSDQDGAPCCSYRQNTPTSGPKISFVLRKPVLKSKKQTGEEEEDVQRRKIKKATSLPQDVPLPSEDDWSSSCSARQSTPTFQAPSSSGTSLSHSRKKSWGLDKVDVQERQANPRKGTPFRKAAPTVSFYSCLDSVCSRRHCFDNKEAAQYTRPTPLSTKSRSVFLCGVTCEPEKGQSSSSGSSSSNESSTSNSKKRSRGEDSVSQSPKKQRSTTVTSQTPATKGELASDSRPSSSPSRCAKRSRDESEEDGPAKKCRTTPCPSSR